MGSSTSPPVIVESLTDWQEFHKILSSSAYRTLADAEWGNNYVSAVTWTGTYDGGFKWETGDRIEWSMPAGGSVTATAKTEGSTNDPIRIPDIDCYDFLVFVLNDEPSGLVTRLSATQAWNDFYCSRAGTAFQIRFDYKDSVSKFAKAKLVSGSFQNLTIT